MAEPALAGADGLGDQLGHPGIALQADHLGKVERADPDLGHQSGHGRERHPGLAE